MDTIVVFDALLDIVTTGGALYLSAKSQAEYLSNLPNPPKDIGQLTPEEFARLKEGSEGTYFILTGIDLSG